MSSYDTDVLSKTFMQHEQHLDKDVSIWLLGHILQEYGANEIGEAVDKKRKREESTFADAQTQEEIESNVKKLLLSNKITDD